MTFNINQETFTVTVEVVPPVGPDPRLILEALTPLGDLALDGFNVATNPLAKPRMSALALSALIQQRVQKPVILHVTTRDHNRLSLQGLLWGARGLDIDTVLISTGDFVSMGDRADTTTVRDVDVFDLIRMAREAGLRTGAVLNVRPQLDRWRTEVRWLRYKVEAGAQFVITQPAYDAAGVARLEEAMAPLGIPVLMGILPLRSPEHAGFLHHRVIGIDVPEPVRQRMEEAADPVAEGAANARKMLTLARQTFNGACLMPPFGHYEIVFDILDKKGS
jgi:homocysteine S-methyltransferase